MDDIFQDKLLVFGGIIGQLVQGGLWAFLSSVIIIHYDLEKWWYLIASFLLVLLLSHEILQQKFLLPRLLGYLGCESNERIEALRKIRVTDYLSYFAILYGASYWAST